MGLGQTEAAEWGYDIQRAIADAGRRGLWWTGLYPGVAIVLLVTGLSLLGEGLNDIINPVLRKRPIRPVHFPRRKDPHRRGEGLMVGERVLEGGDLGAHTRR